MSAAFDVTPRRIGCRDHSGGFRGFIFTPAAWYAKAIGKDRAGEREVMIGIYHPGGGTSGEFAIREQSLGGSFALRLEVWSDGWSALALFPDLLALLAEHDVAAPSLQTLLAERHLSGRSMREQLEEHDRGRLTLEALRPLLVGLGIQDRTPEVAPQ
jgi:hypothetical protein